MADSEPTVDAAGEQPTELAGGTYEVLKNRLDAQANELRSRLAVLNEDRKAVFGAIETALLKTERVTTDHNCVPQDMVAVGQQLIFGYNVRFGLKTEHELSDVFAVYEFNDNSFKESSLDLIGDAEFARDYRELYKYYRHATFAKFFRTGPFLYFVFQVGKTPDDIKAFKWTFDGDKLRYLDSRSDHEVGFPPQHEFAWSRATRDQHRTGRHPHVSIDDRFFVECIGGDLTIKMEDNTETGEGIYAEPVDEADQTLDDAEISYALLGHLVLLRIRPYRENAYRYLVCNEKTRSVVRVDSLADAGILLPDEQGLIFPNGYYLQTGESKLFDQQLDGMLFERRVQAPNGEDFLFVFYNQTSGLYVLLRYNIIAQQVDTPLLCHGFCLYPAGEMIAFQAHKEPQRHHPLQVWRTPFVDENYDPPQQNDSYLFQVGNRDIVRAMAECQELLNLVGKDDSYQGLYLDLVRLTTGILDSYFWLTEAATHRLDEPLKSIRETANSAVSEFEKVRRQRAETKKRTADVVRSVDELFSAIKRERFEDVNTFVAALTKLRTARGEVLALRELRYVDEERIAQLDATLAEESNRLSERTVRFLLRDESLRPYEQKVAEDAARIDALEKVTEAKALGESIQQTADDLELLVEVVGNLDIDDATQRTAIVDQISVIFSQINQARSRLKNRTQQLLSREGSAEFQSQMNLLSQSVVNYLDLSDTPEKSDENLTKLMVQLEELEAKFAEFDEFLGVIAEKRDEIYNAFEARKLSLLEARNKRAAALEASAQRILTGIRSRVQRLDSVAEISAYYASDLMIEKVRDLIEQLEGLDESVKVDAIRTQLKTIREDAVRQLKDRQELYVDGENRIKLGSHVFSVNTRPVDLTMLLRDGLLNLHLTGTDFFEPIRDPRLLETKPVWDQDVISENERVYRAEYLAQRLATALDQSVDGLPPADELRKSDPEAVRRVVQEFMTPRYSEEYTKGVHDLDAAKILSAMLDLRHSLGLLTIAPEPRALARVFWQHFCDTRTKNDLEAKCTGFGALLAHFPDSDLPPEVLSSIELTLAEFIDETELFDAAHLPAAAEYLFRELTSPGAFVVSGSAAELVKQFHAALESKRLKDSYDESLKSLRKDLVGYFELLRDWLDVHLKTGGDPSALPYRDEAAALLMEADWPSDAVLHAEPTRALDGMLGNHARVEGGEYQLNWHDFSDRLGQFESETVPLYKQFHDAKREVLTEAHDDLGLDELKPRVLSSFVRNRLLDEVYLPLIGDNFAKQIGTAGDQTRTDRMGLLLLVSPPGYGKTTLMEYLASRLGLVFMKINGPSIGHEVTSVDPETAPNAGAREELIKLNLAFEMGDNVLIYLDDIQHLHPEFLQKFISLCDAQRRIEGVWRGEAKTYDFRGRKVAVVMAGNPYTESGEKFRIPDMLSNRADIYNLGEIIGEHDDAFEMSYLENAVTSNPVLATLAGRSQGDVRKLIRMAKQGSTEGIELEGNYAADELSELLSVLQKLMRVRDVVLTVNREYIRSAAMADEYRTEPPFKLQGSYRNMNRIAEKVLPVMNDAELESLIQSSYENDAQTLTSDAEANLLKFRELTGVLSDEQRERWESIQQTFLQTNRLRGMGADDKTGQVIVTLQGLQSSLDAIGNAVSGSAQELATRPDHEADLASALAGLREHLASASGNGHAPESKSDSNGEPREIRVVNKLPTSVVSVLKKQFELMDRWLGPILSESREQSDEIRRLASQLDAVKADYEKLIGYMEGNRK